MKSAHRAEYKARVTDQMKNAPDTDDLLHMFSAAQRALRAASLDAAADHVPFGFSRTGFGPLKAMNGELRGLLPEHIETAADEELRSWAAQKGHRKELTNPEELHLDEDDDDFAEHSQDLVVTSVEDVAAEIMAPALRAAEATNANRRGTTRRQIRPPRL